MGEGLLQPMHLLVIFFIALLIFGPKKLPELGKEIGNGIRAMREGLRGDAERASKETANPNALNSDTKS